MASITQQSSFAIPQKGDGSFGGKTARVIDFYMAVQIETTASAGKSTIGLYQDSLDSKYYFRWITGRPDYGAMHPPLGEVNPASLWKIGMITGLKGFGQIVRMIDIIVQGNYGSLSGCNFKIQNTDENSGKPFWQEVHDNDYYLINRNVKIYAVINDIFYQVWGGIVSKTSYNETIYNFTCEDNYKNIHKAFPPIQLTKESFPGIDPEFIGQVMPVSLGKVFKSKVMDITGKATPMVMDVRGELLIYATVAHIYSTVSEFYFVQLISLEKEFTQGFFNNGNYYLRVVRGSEIQSIQILASDVSVWDVANQYFVTTIYLTTPLEGVTISSFNAQNSYSAGGADFSTDSWLFEVVKMDVYYLTSEKPIAEYLTDSKGKYELTTYLAERRDYQEISELLLATDTVGVGQYPHPNVVIQNADLDIEGTFKRVVPIVAESIVYKGIEFKGSGTGYITYDDFEVSSLEGKFNDIWANRLDSDSYALMVFSPGVLPLNFQWRQTYDVTMPTKTVLDGLDKLYIMPHFHIFQGSGHTKTYQFKFRIRTKGPLGKKYYLSETYSTKPGYDLAMFDYLPDEYYDLSPRGYERNGVIDRASLFGKQDAGTDFNAMFEIPEDIISSFNDVVGSREFEFQIECYPNIGYSTATSFQLYQIGFVGTKNINIIKEDIYTKLDGELYAPGQPTSNFYNGFRHILENYDGIPSSSINYGNLGWARNDWQMGRQILNRDKSSKLLKEMAQQSFVGIFPTRTGKRGLSAFRENITPIYTFNESNIQKDKILSFVKSSFSKCYNDFTINYDYNPALSKFNKSIRITHVDASAFPGYFDTATGNVIKPIDHIVLYDNRQRAEMYFPTNPGAWASVGFSISYSGSTGDIYFAKILYIDSVDDRIGIEYPTNMPPRVLAGGTCYYHGDSIPQWTMFASGIPDYALAKSLWEICHASYLQTLTVNPFKIDAKWFQDNDNFINGTGGTGNAVFLYLRSLVEWATRLKDVVNLRIWINEETILLELLTPVTFEDDYYTNAVARLGWVTKKKINPGKRTIDFEIVLNPTDIEIDNSIIQTGSGDGDFEETGTGTDIIEGGA